MLNLYEKENIMIVFHSTETCWSCGKDSYKSTMDIVRGNDKCVWCNTCLFNPPRKKTLDKH